MQVRLGIASQLHDTARFISKDRCCGLLTRPLVALLCDESSAVQAAVLPMLNTTLQVSPACRPPLTHLQDALPVHLQSTS